MSPDRAEVYRGKHFVKKLALGVANMGLAFGAACTPQSPQVQEIPTPTIFVVTATPTETPPTVVPTLEPTATSIPPELPPVATSTPVSRELPPPTSVQEVLFQTPAWSVHRGALIDKAAQPPEGQIVITTLPSGDIHIYVERKKACDNDVIKFSINSFIVNKSSIAGRGFSQTDQFSNVVTAGVIREGLLGGNVIFKDDPVVAGEPNCKGKQLSFQAEKRGIGKGALGIELAAAKKAVSGGDNNPEDMLKLAENLCKCILPELK